MEKTVFTPPPHKEIKMPDNYGIQTKAFFSLDSLKSKMILYSLPNTETQTKHGKDILLSFYRLAEDPEKVVAAQCVDKPAGSLAVKHDLKKYDTYSQSVADMTYNDIVKNFGKNITDIMGYIDMIKTVNDVKDYVLAP